MRELFDKIKQLDKGLALDLHRSMFSVEHDTVLIVVDIRRILESPLAVIDRDRNDAVILSGRVIEAPCIPLVLHTELTFRVSRNRSIARSGNGFRIFFRFGQIDGNIQCSVVCVYIPSAVLFDPVPADVIAVLTELVIKLSGGFRRFLIMSPEVVLNLSRTRQQAVHQSGVEQITIADAVFNDAACNSLLKEIGKDVFQHKICQITGDIFPVVFMEYIQK